MHPPPWWGRQEYRAAAGCNTSAAKIDGRPAPSRIGWPVFRGRGQARDLFAVQALGTRKAGTTAPVAKLGSSRATPCASRCGQEVPKPPTQTAEGSVVVNPVAIGLLADPTARNCYCLENPVVLDVGGREKPPCDFDLASHAARAGRAGGPDR